MGTIVKGCAGCLYAAFFGVLGLTEHVYHTGFLPATTADGAGGMPFWENFGLSCISNVLLGGMFVFGFGVQDLLRRIYFRRPLFIEPAVYCVREVEPRAAQEQRFEIIEERASLRITPSMLWYYMYSMGWGIFCLGYTLHGGHFVSALCLCGSSLAGALWAAEGMLCVTVRKKGDPRRILLWVGGLCNVGSMGLSIWQFKGWSQRELWASWAVVLVCPLLTPWWLSESREKMSPLNLSTPSMVMFGLPFTCVLSAGFLSLYIPLQDCRMPGNSSSTLLWAPLLSKDALSKQSVWELAAGGVLVPPMLYGALVVYTSAFLWAEKRLACMNGLWLVVAARHMGSIGSEPVALALCGWLLAVGFMVLHGWMDRVEAVTLHDIYGEAEDDVDS